MGYNTGTQSQPVTSVCQKSAAISRRGAGIITPSKTKIAMWEVANKKPVSVRNEC